MSVERYGWSVLPFLFENLSDVGIFAGLQFTPTERLIMYQNLELS